MKIAVLLVVTLFIAAGEAGRCSLINGQNLIQFGGRNLAIKHECKFNMVQEKCGNYEVTLTPGLKYIYPTYIIDTAWLGVKDLSTGKFWEGRTTNKVVAKYIIGAYYGQAREAWNYKGGDLHFSDIFTLSSSSSDVTITSKDSSFAITTGPYDFHGDGHKDSTLIYECFVPTVHTPFPTQYCGSADGNEIKDVTKSFFGDSSLLDYSLPYFTFNDISIVQENPYCIEATAAFTTTCSSHLARRDAIASCEAIIQSSPRTQCIVKHDCSPMPAFVACLQYSCSNYTDKGACERLGAGIDLCRLLPEVRRYDLPSITQTMKESDCYKDLLTQEDNPYYTAA